VPITPRAWTSFAPDQATPSPNAGTSSSTAAAPSNPVKAKVLLRVWADGGIDTGDAAQRQAFDALAGADMVKPARSSTSCIEGRRGCAAGYRRSPSLCA